MLGFESHHRSGFSLNHFHSLCGKDYEMIMILIKIRLFKTLRVVDNSFFFTHDFQDADVSKDVTASTHIIIFLYFTHSICVGQLVDNSLRLQPFFGREVISCESLDLLCFTLPLLLLLLFIAFPFGYVLFLVFLSFSVFPPLSPSLSLALPV